MPNLNRRTSVVGPVILIVVGALFLLRSWRPEFSPWSILWTYWPLILIAVGLGKIWDYSRQRQAAADPNSPNAGRANAFSVGTTIAIVAFVLVVVAAMWNGGRRLRARNIGGSMSHEEHVVDLQGAKKVNASIQMGAGELSIRSG